MTSSSPKSGDFNLHASQVNSMKELLDMVDLLGSEVSYQNEHPTLSSLPVVHAFGFRQPHEVRADRVVAQVSWSGFTFLQTSPEVARLWQDRGLGWRGVLGFGSFLLRPELLQHYAHGSYSLYDKISEEDAVAACLFIEQAIRKLCDVSEDSGLAIVPDDSFKRDGEEANSASYLQFSIAIPCSERTWDHGMMLLQQCAKAATMLETAMSADAILKEMKDIQEKSKSLPPSSDSIH